LSPKHSFLSTFLLQEKRNASSFWKPYLDMLPSDYDTVPIFFPDEDLAWLQGSPFLDQVKEKKADIKKDYDAICKVAPEFSQYSFQEFCWARMTASSRIFGIVIGETKTDAFVPLADMLNHRRPKQTSWFYSNEKEGFIIESLEDVPRGEPVYDSYGKKCNSRFFLNYGFIVQENDGNEVAIKVHFKSNDSCLELKEKMMGESGMPKTFRVMASTEEEAVVEFMNFIRFVEIKDNNSLLEVMNIYENAMKRDEKEREGGYKPQKTPPISVELEMKVLERVKELCESQLKKYKTTLKEDKELLKTDLTQNQRNSVDLRSGEKEILHYLINFTEKTLPLLMISSKNIRKAVLQAPHNQYSEYIKKVIIPLMHKKEKANE